MENPLSLKTFLDRYGEDMADKVTSDLKVVHDPSTTEPEIEKTLKDLKKKPFPSQAEIIKGSYKSLISGNKAVYTVCEMGTGKTLMAIAIGYLLHKLNHIKRILIICPPHLVSKWIKEVKDSLPVVKVHNLNHKNVITRLDQIRKSPAPTTLELYVIGRERAKTGFLWRPAAIEKDNRLFCPKCGKELLDKDHLPLGIFETNRQGKYKKRHTCNNQIEKWKYDPKKDCHTKIRVQCKEQLWQPDTGNKKYRKAIPAKYIKKKMKNHFDLLIADEVHMYKNQSGQGYAFGALATASKYTLCLTGTLAGGYSSDVYHLLFRTHPQLMIEDNNQWGNPKKFIERYGILERMTIVKEEDGLTTKAKKRTVLREKPGISPLLLGRILLSKSVFMRLSDCIDYLQPYEEEVIELDMPSDMAGLYTEFENNLKEALRNALATGDNSLLGGYLHGLLSYPERIFEGLEIKHPRTKEIVAYGPPLDGIMPKEEELVAIINDELQNNRKVLVYYQNSQSTDISPRIVSMLEEENIRARVLKSGNTQKRAEIIDRWVEKGLDVLMTNPRKVEVGMDLLDFPTIIFYQIPMSTYTLRQASRRSWRIPQENPVKVYFLTYRGTLQTRLMNLMADKLISSLALEGELSDRGLAALSNSSDSMAMELAKVLLEKREAQSNLKGIWADYRKKEVMVEAKMNRNINDPEPKAIPLTQNVSFDPAPAIKTVETAIDQIGDKILKVDFIEYMGKRKKKVTHIEINQSELDKIFKEKDNAVHVQYSLF